MLHIKPYSNLARTYKELSRWFVISFDWRGLDSIVKTSLKQIFSFVKGTYKKKPV